MVVCQLVNQLRACKVLYCVIYFVSEIFIAMKLPLLEPEKVIVSHVKEELFFTVFIGQLQEIKSLDGHVVSVLEYQSKVSFSLLT